MDGYARLSRAISEGIAGSALDIFIVVTAATRSIASVLVQRFFAS